MSSGSGHKRIFNVLMLSLFLTALLPGCGDDSSPVVDTTLGPPPGPTEDKTPPTDITALLLKTPTPQAVYLVWTSPGDDGAVGTATQYDIRYSTEPLDNSNWDSATQFDGEPVPKPAGQPENVKIGSLLSVTTYHFGVKTGDEADNWSGLSNIVSGKTLQETQPPARVWNLSVVRAGPDAFRLSWTAPGDDGVYGTASRYDIRYHTSPITADSWRNATKITAPAPQPAGTKEVLVTDNIPGDEVYWFAMKVADEVPNWTRLSNIRFVVGARVEMYLPQTDLVAGEEMKIHYLAPGGTDVAIRLCRYVPSSGCDPYGPENPWCYMDIMNNVVLPEGQYFRKCDFMVNGEYLESAYYYVTMCWGSELQTFQTVYFTNE